jgi:putative hydrolase of the HAD superfamily
MNKRALIFDLDDTIYPTKSVVSEMYKDLFSLLEGGVSKEVLDNIREGILATPFHIIAERYALDKEYNGSMQPFPDYGLTKENSADRFLVTAGYTRLQKSKIRQLGIAKEFKEIFIPDPYTSDLSKTDVFRQILNTYHYDPAEVLVIGDNPETEIAAAKELGIESCLYDYEAKFSPALADYYGTSYQNFPEIKIV